MKILAIRGKNLASLSSEFEVDFQAEPLASAGLFAITGPTGAGKSTLLDALCLALYDGTPRLDKATARNSEVPDVGDTSIAQHDPRTILRRGAAEGFAEVDFVGNDGISYRARWTVRRAHGRAEGKLQNSEVILENLTDRQLLGDRRKTETLKLIESKIGLTFAQFTRAVLLAQNDFATFLRATDDERAELLQTLTGTEAFADISRQAFLRMREEKEQLDRLKEQMNTLAPLTPELRGEKETQHRGHDEQLKALEKTKSETESWLHWYEQLTKQRAVEAEADKKLEAATATRIAADPRCQKLALIEQVQPARPLFAEQARLTSEIAASEKAVEERLKELNLAAKTVEARSAACDTAGKQLSQAEEAKMKAQPSIDAAKALDVRISALEPPYAQALKIHVEAERQYGEFARKVTEAKQAVQHTEATRTAAEHWLSEHRNQKPLAEGWQGWDALFSQAFSQNTDKTKLTADIVAMTKRVGKIVVLLTQAQTAFATQAKEHQSAQNQLVALTTAWKAFDAEAMAKRKQQLEARREQLVQGETLWSESVTLRQRHLQLEAQIKTATASVENLGKQLEELVQQKPRREQDCAAATRAHDLAQLAASENAEFLRASLQADQPCPVCGALEHPYAEHSPQAGAMLKALKDELGACQKALTALSETMAARTSDRTHAQNQLMQLEKDLAEAGRAKTENQVRWSSLPITAEASVIEDGSRLSWFVEQQNQLTTALAQLTKEEDNHRKATKQKDDAQLALNRSHETLETARKSVIALETEQKTARHTAETAQQSFAEVEKKLEATLAKLDGAFSNMDWRAKWQADPQKFVANCRRDAEAWLGQQKQFTELTGQATTQKATLTAQAESCAKAETDLNAAANRLRAQDVELNALRIQRQALFGGKRVKDIEAELERAIEYARTQQTKVQDELQKAQGERTRLDEAWRQATELHVKHQGAQAEATRKFDVWLREFSAQSREDGLSVESLRALLAFDDAWIVQERKALQALDQAVATASAVKKTLREGREAHEKTKSTELGEDILKGNLAKLRTEIVALQEICAKLRAEILADDDRQKRAKELLEAMAKQEQNTRLWSQLGELIGSADGKKFRNFAQQLTLDILLGYGNRHLESLSRRYRLERIKDSLGLLVIDQDMGDEVRSVHSLSGGESFLLSLALALGLASLSSHRVRVESLFIDEGFGSLDSESLRMALDALDTLQALGRKVGVISHVQEMTERIGVQIQVRRQFGGQSRVAVSST